MGFSEPFIRRPIGTALLAAGVLLAGVMAFFALPVAAVPSIPVPGIVIFASEPGASPAIMASTVAAPLEQTLQVIPGVNEVRSLNSTGSSTIIILFDSGTNIDADAHAVQAAIDAALPNLPSGMPSLPFYRVFNPASRPVMTMFLSSRTMPLRQVYDFANTVIVQMLSQVSGVAQVNLYGGESPAVRIRFDPHALAAAGLTPNDIFNAIRTANVLAPLGIIQGAHRGSILAVNGQLSTAAQYRRIVLKTSGGAVLRLGDVASVIDGVSNTQVSATDGHNPGIVVAVTKTATANVLQTVQGIRARMPEIARYLPASVHLRIMTDRTTTIRASVTDIEFTLLITIVLVLLVVTVFMRRVTPIIAAGITVPLSIAGTLAAMWAFGYSLDNFSLLALTISVGFVVDDAIVMIENIVARHEQGMPGMQAAILGARQIGYTVMSITASLIVVFLPLTLMGGVIGGLFNEFAVTLSVSIAISGLISLTVTPMICAHFMGRTPRLGRDSRPARAIDAFYRRTLAAYARSLEVALAHPRLTLASFVLTIAVTLFLYTKVPKAFIPEEDTGLVSGQTIAAPDVSFDRMQRLQAQVVRIVQADPAVATLSSRIGVVNGFSTANRGNLIIGLKPLSERNVSAQQVIQRLRARVARIPGIQIFMHVEQDLFFGGQQTGGEYSFSVLDPSLERLDTTVARIEARLRGLKSITTVSSDQDRAETQLTVTIDRDAAARLGVTIGAIDTALGNAFGQRQISRIYQAQNQYSVVLTVGAAHARGPADLERIYLPGSRGPVPLGQVAHLERATAPLQVAHANGVPAGTISFNLAPGASLGPATEAVKAAVAGMRLPADVTIDFSGNAAYFLKSLQSEPILILAALVAIYIVLGVLYESLSQPLTILSTLPSAGAGALLAFLLTGTPLSVVGIIGIFLLMGIVKKNGIMLVDFALEAERERNLPPAQAIREACLERFRPIMMTTLAALLGALPLALSVGTGYQIRRPLGIAVIGGLIVCQALTLYTTPVIYLALAGFGKRRARRFATMPAE